MAKPGSTHKPPRSSIREVNYDFQDTGKPTEGSCLSARWALTFSRSSYDAIAMVVTNLGIPGLGQTFNQA